jgi:hypothetical protein
MNPLLKMIMTSSWFVRFMGSHLSSEEEAARALGGLLMDAKYAAVTGAYSMVSGKFRHRQNHETKKKPSLFGTKAWLFAGWPTIESK